MKKFILLAVFAIALQQVSGQERLGKSASDIRKEYAAAAYNLQTGFDDDGDYYLSVEVERAIVFYYFKSVNDPCYVTVIYPKRQGDLNYYVEQYNKSYVIISATSWRKYSVGGYSNIVLKYDGDYSWFVFYLPTED